MKLTWILTISILISSLMLSSVEHEKNLIVKRSSQHALCILYALIAKDMLYIICHSLEIKLKLLHQKYYTHYQCSSFIVLLLLLFIFLMIATGTVVDK